MTDARPPDLRAVVLAAFAWVGGLAGFLLPPTVTAGLLGLGAVHLAVRRHRGRPVLVRLAWLVAAVAVAGSAVLRVEATERHPVRELAEEEAFVTAVVRVASDPLVRPGRFAPFTITRVTTLEVTGRGETHGGRVPVLVLADESWREVELGSVIRVAGRVSVPDGSDLAAVLSTSRPVLVLEEPGDVLDAAAAVRQGIRRAVAGAGHAERTLVPALVVGDDQGMPPHLQRDFRVSGLTHLLAVSGTNLTLVVGFLLIVARWVGVRARGLLLVGVLGVLGFILLARTEPSVVRAAAMGSVALLGMSSNGREKGVRALGVAVLVLLLLDPRLALSVGFVLSALATAGILFLAPPWRDALRVWMPRWAAEAISVPMAAQLACTPVVAAISDQVSLVAVVANMVAAPAVGPATVLGLAGGLVVLVVPPLGALLGRAAGGCAWWITSTAERSAALPTAAVDWAASWLSISLLTGLCVLVVAVMPRVLDRRGRTAGVALLMLLAVVRPLPTPGWPPAGWVMVACDVGQGDALVLNAGGGRAVLVDAGPDPVLVDRCLDRLEVRSLAAVVLTHFHHDHVGGLPGARDGRPLGELVVTGLADPEEGAEQVHRWAQAQGIPVRVPRLGESTEVGQLRWQVVGPSLTHAAGRAGAGESPANNASIALVVEVAEVRILLTGDVEPAAQRVLAATLGGTRVDVLKVPHHGSRHQHPELLTGLGARLALVPVGDDNGYGHPSPATIALLEAAGMRVHRTDEAGDIAVVVDEGQLTVRELRTSSSSMR